jgi:hypothetical protein
VLAAWSESGVIKAAVITVSGNSVSNGTIATVEGTSGTDQIDLEALSATKVMMVYHRTSATASVKAIILDISGTTITPATAVVIDTTSTPNRPRVCQLSATKCVAVWYRSGANDAYSVVLDVSGSTITVNSLQAIDATATAANIDVCALDSTHAMVVYKDADTFLTAAILTISGSSISVGTLNTNLSDSIVFGGTGDYKVYLEVLNATDALCVFHELGGAGTGSLYACILRNASGTITRISSMHVITDTVGNNNGLSVAKSSAGNYLITYDSGNSGPWLAASVHVRLPGLVSVTYSQILGAASNDFKVAPSTTGRMVGVHRGASGFAAASAMDVVI